MMFRRIRQNQLSGLFGFNSYKIPGTLPRSTSVCFFLYEYRIYTQIEKITKFFNKIKRNFKKINKN